MPGLTEEAVGALTPVPEAPAGPRRIITGPGPFAIVIDAEGNEAGKVIQGFSANCNVSTGISSLSTLYILL